MRSDARGLLRRERMDRDGPKQPADLLRSSRALVIAASSANHSQSAAHVHAFEARRAISQYPGGHRGLEKAQDSDRRSLHREQIRDHHSLGSGNPAGPWLLAGVRPGAMKFSFFCHS